MKVVLWYDVRMRPARQKSICVLLIPVMLLCACDDSDRQTGIASDGRSTGPSSIAPRPAPKPQRVALTIRASRANELPTGLMTGPRYELFSTYDGQDIRQVVGVSGRTLWLCFTAPWCPYSKRMIEELKQLADQEKGNVQVVQVDADAYPALAEQFGITKVPTTFLYTEGVKLRTIEGAYNAPSMRRFLRRILTRGDAQDPGASDLLVTPSL